MDLEASADNKKAQKPKCAGFSLPDPPFIAKLPAPRERLVVYRLLRNVSSLLCENITDDEICTYFFSPCYISGRSLYPTGPRNDCGIHYLSPNDYSQHENVLQL